MAAKVAEDGSKSSPAEVAQALNELHKRGDYSAIARLITEDRREAVIAILKAFDSVIAADADIQEAAVRRFGEQRVAWNLSVMRNNIGVFSSDTTLINQRFFGDRAVVALQEGDQVPLVRAPFRRVDRRWLYDPDLPPESMTWELSALGDVLARILREVEQGADYAEYLAAFHARVVPQIERVVAAKDPLRTEVIVAGEEE